MGNIKVLVVEDDFIIAHDIVTHLKSNGYDILGVVQSGEVAIAKVKRESPDILLLDIKLDGELDGIETAEVVNNIVNIPIIYITASTDPESINRAKKTSPHAYIIKPFNFNNLQAAIELAIYNFSSEKKADISEARNYQYPETNEYLSGNAVFIKKNRRLQKIKPSDFLYISAEGSYCKIITTQEKYTLSCNLHTLLEKINHKIFVRLHRSYAVNIHKVDVIEEDYVIIGKEKLPIGRSYKSNLMEKINAL
jgi:DNA-binding LytR/AlgR family response regulator